MNAGEALDDAIRDRMMECHNAMQGIDDPAAFVAAAKDLAANAMWMRRTGVGGHWSDAIDAALAAFDAACGERES